MRRSTELKLSFGKFDTSQQNQMHKTQTQALNKKMQNSLLPIVLFSEDSILTPSPKLSQGHSPLKFGKRAKT